MNRQSISLTTPNDAWLLAQVGRDKEYTSKSDVVNDLIRKARADQEKLAAIRSKLATAEQSGFVKDAHPERMLKRIKGRMRRG